MGCPTKKRRIITLKTKLNSTKKKNINVGTNKYFKVLEKAGIKRNSKSWAEYGRAKIVIMNLFDKDYKNKVRSITKYIGLA